MTEWWEALSAAQQLFFGIAIVSSTFLLLQFVLTLVGLDADGVDGDFDADFDADGDVETDAEGDSDAEKKSVLKFITIRNMLAFFTGFSWTGLYCLDIGIPFWITMPIAGSVGLILMGIVMGIMYGLSRMVEKGNVSSYNAVGHTGIVSIEIGKNQSSAGKVRVSFHGGLREVRAITNGQELYRGDPIKVIGVSDGELLVEKQKIVKS